MRKLMWFTVGLSAATALCAYWLFGTVVLLIAIVAALIATAMILIRKIQVPILIAVLIGFSFGMLYNWGYHALFLDTLKSYDGKTVDAQIQATDYSFDTGYGMGVDGMILLEEEQYRVRLYFHNTASVIPGDILQGNVRIRYTAENGLQPATYHKGEGIFLLAYAEDLLYHKPVAHVSSAYFAATLRKDIAERIDTVFPEDTAAFGKALLLGDDSGIGYSDNVAFQKSGIRHVIAVSGLHISILFSVIYFLTGRKKLLTLFVGIPILFLFAAVAGFTPSVMRACVMQALIILAIALEREYDPATALSFSVLVMLIANPLTVTSVSFQLSVGCMIGIFLFSQRIREYLLQEKRLGRWNGKNFRGKLVRWLAGSISVSVSAMVFTLPLCAVYFDMVSLIGIISNLLILWVISFTFCGIIVACLLSSIWLPLGSLIATVISVPVRYILLTARLLSRIPWGVAYTDSAYTVLWIVVSYCLVILFIFCKQKRPLLLAGVLIGTYILSQTATWLEPRLDAVRLTAVDVGQGQCLILQSGDAAYMIDCGGEDPEETATQAMNWMGAQGITSLDGVILTHFDEDHVNGADLLMEIVPVDMLYVPDVERENPLREQLTATQKNVRWLNDPISISCGEGQMILLPAEDEIIGNESSMCILFQGETCDILITGDRDWEGEQQLLSQWNIPDIDVLVAGHHGAKTSTGLALLQQTQPEICVISAGQNNIHGHPEQDTLSRLEKIGCLIFRTDLKGTVIIRG